MRHNFGLRISQLLTYNIIYRCNFHWTKKSDFFRPSEQNRLDNISRIDISVSAFHQPEWFQFWSYVVYIIPHITQCIIFHIDQSSHNDTTIFIFSIRIEIIGSRHSQSLCVGIPDTQYMQIDWRKNSPNPQRKHCILITSSTPEVRDRERERETHVAHEYRFERYCNTVNMPSSAILLYISFFHHYYYYYNTSHSIADEQTCVQLTFCITLTPCLITMYVDH